MGLEPYDVWVVEVTNDKGGTMWRQVFGREADAERCYADACRTHDTDRVHRWRL